ncbi:hypothetical protein D1BOALGB6SA_1690 [Olavius sp. associated proteobacterium Delta 1]|nr:hypothetical protein D1BOALGB6SA_1690 [Olavius sp. associated proteobacterium Delta 1]
MNDIQDLLDGLRRSGNILSQFVKSIPAEKMNLRRGEGFWTIAEHVSHLAQVQPMLLERLHRFMHEDRPEFVPYVPGDAETEAGPPHMEKNVALESFTHHRAKQLTLLKKADEADWQKTAIHPEYERYSLYILVRHILMHDHWHMYRMEELWLTRDAYLTKLD